MDRDGVAGGAAVGAGGWGGETVARVWMHSLSPHEMLGFRPALPRRVKPQWRLPFPNDRAGPRLQQDLRHSAHKSLDVFCVWGPAFRVAVGAWHRVHKRTCPPVSRAS